MKTMLRFSWRIYLRRYTQINRLSAAIFDDAKYSLGVELLRSLHGQFRLNIPSETHLILPDISPVDGYTS